MSSHPAPAVSVDRLVVLTGRILCDVSLSREAPRTTSPELMDRITPSFPHLARHACVNDEGPTFGAVMDRTSLPHLLEHLVIDLQVRASAQGRMSARTIANALPVPSDAGSASARIGAHRPPGTGHPPAPSGADRPFGTSRPSASPGAEHPSDAPPGAHRPPAAGPASAADGPVFMGTTEWTDERAGRARIQISFADDLVALRAIRDAVDFLNEALLSAPCGNETATES